MALPGATPCRTARSACSPTLLSSTILSRFHHQLGFGSFMHSVPLSSTWPPNLFFDQRCRRAIILESTSSDKFSRLQLTSMIFWCQELQETLHHQSRVAAKLGLKFNARKCASLNFNNEKPFQVDLFVGESPIRCLGPDDQDTSSYKLARQ